MSGELSSFISRSNSENSLLGKVGKSPTTSSNHGSHKRRKLSKSRSAMSLSHGRRRPFSYPIRSSHEVITEGEQTHIDSLSHKIHPLSVIFAILFIVCYRKVNMSSIFLSLLIFLSLRESLQTVRLARIDNTIYQIRMLLQIIGDLLIVPYNIVFKQAEKPLVQFQNTKLNRFIFDHVKSFKKYSQTPWCVHAYFQFILLVIEEQYRSKEKLDIFRELVYTKDGGMVALDWWLPLNLDKESNNNNKNTTTNNNVSREEHIKRRKTWNYCESKCGKYKSKVFYEFNKSEYDKYFVGKKMNNMYKGENTPILFVFSTYFGDSMGAPQKKLCKYFMSRNWKVVVYCKRGCGSPYVEMLPLTNCKLFDLQGLTDSKLVVDIVSKKYPNAPLFCAGFSVGGNMVHDFLALLNNKNGIKSISNDYTKGNIGNDKYFMGGIKIDGMTCWYSDLLKFNARQGFLSQILASLPFEQLQAYVKNNPKEAEDSGYNLDAFLLENSGKPKTAAKRGRKKKFAKSMSDVDMSYVVKHLFTVGSDSNLQSCQWKQYAQRSGPTDIGLIDAPMLALNSWNDSFQSPEDNPIGIAEVNPNIIHCVNRGGTHCIRREGMFFQECWISKTCFEYCQAVLDYGEQNGIAD